MFGKTIDEEMLRRIDEKNLDKQIFDKQIWTKNILLIIVRLEKL